MRAWKVRFARWHAARVEESNRQRGFTLIEILVATTLMGIVMVPISMATMLGWRTVFGVEQQLAKTTDAQVLGATFPADVQSAGATGVNPTDPVNQDICAASVGGDETPLIMFVWDDDLGVSNQSVARYIAKGSGTNSKIIRRFCKGNADPVDEVVARNFGTKTGLPAQNYTLGDDGRVTPQCTATDCYLQITGDYSFRLKVDRRVPGAAPGAFVPNAPTNVHAIGGNTRATVYWTDPANNGAPITGYYVEQTPGGIQTGPYPTTGTNGAQINGLINGQSYTFRVLAVNVLGPSPYSTPSGAVTPGPTTPDAPTIGTATPDPAVNGRATVSWSIPSGYNNGGAAVTGYKVYAQHAPDAPIVVSVGNPATTSVAVTGLSDNIGYTFQVSATNLYGEGSPSTASSEALTLPGAPGTPSAQFTGTSGSVDVTFALPSSGDFTRYTSFRARIVETNTTMPAVAAATACPGTTPATCTLTVTGIGSGQSYSIKVQAQNGTGWGPESVAVTNVDLTAPIVSLTSPSTTYVNSATPAFSGAAGTAAGDLSTVTVNVYSGATATGSPVQTRTATAASGIWTVAASPALTSGQQYTAVATQRDSTGNVGMSTSSTFTVDTVAPTGSVTAPSANSWVSGNVTMNANSADAVSGVASVAFQYSPSGAGSWSTFVTDTGAPYTFTGDTSSLADGPYDLRIVTTDNAGNSTTSAAVTVKVDNTDPVVNVPVVSGASTNGWYTGTVTVTWTPAPSDAYSGIASTSNCGVTTITTDQVGQTVTCTATDNAGNVGTRSTIVKRDATAPSSATLSTLGAFINNGTTLTGTGTDATSGVASIQYLYCLGSSCTPATSIGTSSAGPTFPVVWNGQPANGTYQVQAKVFDAAGFSLLSAKQTVTLDNTAPTGSITVPTANAFVRLSPTITSVPTDTGGSGVQSATFQYADNGGTTWTTIATDTVTPYTTTAWDTTNVDDGPYDLRVITEDKAGNQFTSPIVTVKVDNTAPVVPDATLSPTLPASGWYNVNATVTWTPAPSDAYSGIVGTPCAATTVSTDTSGQVVTCTATDNAGNATTKTVTIKKDAAVPSTATLATLGTIANGKVLTSTAADARSGVASVQYLYCSGASCTPTTLIGSSTTGSTYPVTWNNMPADGTAYRVLARVTDVAGNIKDSTVQAVTIDNTEPAKTAMVMKDIDSDGKVDQVVVTFNQTLAAYTAGTDPWTLTHVPSGGSLASVAVSGTTATLTLNEGSGSQDTAVGTFKVELDEDSAGIRDAAGNLSSFAATAPTDGAKPVPVSLVLANKSGGTSGTVESGDTAKITYSEALSVATICTAWSNDAIDHSTTVTATMTNATSAPLDPITLGSTCATVGSVSPAASYLTTTRTFSSTAVAWDVSAEMLTITMGSPSGSVSSGNSSAVPTYTPNVALKDPAGNAIVTGTFSGTSSRF